MILILSLTMSTYIYFRDKYMRIPIVYIFQADLLRIAGTGSGAQMRIGLHNLLTGFTFSCIASDSPF